MISIKSSEEIAIMREGGRMLASILGILEKAVEPGMKTKQLDIIMAEETKKKGGIPSFKGYHGFPANLCVSINDEIVHGIPDDRIIEEGDVVSLDAGIFYKGFHTDSAITVAAGKVDQQTELLIKVTRESLEAGIDQARCGAHVIDISNAVQKYVESKGFAVVREYTGHGVGRELHEDPQIPNFAFEQGPKLQEGMTLAIEPMVNVGDWRTRVSDDHWKVLTADGSLSAHFEHTIAITHDGVEVLTCS